MSSILIAIFCVLLLAVVVVQVAKLSELISSKEGELLSKSSNDTTAKLLVAFMVLFLAGVTWSFLKYKPYMLGYDSNIAASEHGSDLDGLFNLTMFFTLIVFFATQFVLFWFSYKYREQSGKKALFMPHDNKLEVIWTVVPAVVMTFLVVGGLDVWNKVTADVDSTEVLGKDYIEIEATGYQFAWDLRHPGLDSKLGRKNYRLIQPGVNTVGIDFKDSNSHDDFLIADTLYLPVNKKVRVRITSKDVLHNFYLPQFRVKMDAVPGMPTYFVFTPIQTTKDRRAMLSALKDPNNVESGYLYPEWHEPSDSKDPKSPKKCDVFDYELACAELCGIGHYSMRRIIKIVEEDEYNAWLAKQSSAYDSKSLFVKGFKYFKEKIGATETYKTLFKQHLNDIIVNDKSALDEALKLNIFIQSDTSTVNLLSKLGITYTFPTVVKVDTLSTSVPVTDGAANDGQLVTPKTTTTSTSTTIKIQEKAQEVKEVKDDSSNKKPTLKGGYNNRMMNN